MRKKGWNRVWQEGRISGSAEIEQCDIDEGGETI